MVYVRYLGGARTGMRTAGAVAVADSMATVAVSMAVDDLLRLMIEICNYELYISILY